MESLKPINGGSMRYTRLIGTGGIGRGILFQLQGDATLGRSESRLGVLTDAKDYCKLHIIFHYLAVMLGDGAEVLPIGGVGADEAGQTLLAEIAQTGMDCRHIAVHPEAATLFSVCYQYPDKEGGNITTANSASGAVTAAYVRDCVAELEKTAPPRGKQMVMAVPEVPLEARMALLAYGRASGSYNVASLLAEEVDDFLAVGGIELTDLLAVNRDEAAAIAEMPADETAMEVLVEACRVRLAALNPDLSLLVTDGGNGSYACERVGQKADGVVYTPAIKAEVVATAGAGDAFLAGAMTGLCLGLPLCRDEQADGQSGEGKRAIRSVVELGTAMASIAVTSADTIHFGLDAKRLKEDARWDINWC